MGVHTLFALQAMIVLELLREGDLRGYLLDIEKM